MNVAAQLLAHPAIKSLIKFGSQRRYLVAATCCCGLAVLYVVRRRRISARTHAQAQVALTQAHDATQGTHAQRAFAEDSKSDVLESLIDEKRELSLTSVTGEQLGEGETEQSLKDAKRKRKKAKLKQTVLDGVNLVMGESAGKLVESIIDISKSAKKSGLNSFVKSGQLGNLFSKDVVPLLKKKLQNKKFPTIVGTTDSPIGDLHYEISGITLESLEIDPSLQCDITDGSEALQIKVLISSAMLKNIAWKCGTTKIKEKGIANAEIVKAHCMFRITLDKSEIIPKLSIKHCSIDLQQFNLELKGGKASWIYNVLTTIFSNKIKTKLKEKIDKTLTKKCAQFENKINFAAGRVLSLFSKDKKKKIEAAEAQPVPHKKCFLYSNETHNEEIECVLIDLRSFSDISELRVAFFGEVGLPHLATDSAHTRIRFRDRSGTFISVSKSTTIGQLIEHAEFVCFYKNTLSSSINSSHSRSSSNSLTYGSSASSLSLNNSSPGYDFSQYDELYDMGMDGRRNSKTSLEY